MNVYVDDCNGKALATISEQVAHTDSAVSQYSIQNMDGDIIAISTMSRNFGTEVDINDQASGKRIVTVSKGWGQFTDAWTATFRQVLMLLAMIVTNSSLAFSTALCAVNYSIRALAFSTSYILHSNSDAQAYDFLGHRGWRSRSRMSRASSSCC